MSFDLVIYYSVVPIAPVAGIWLPGVIEFIDRMGTYLFTSDSSERLMCIVKRRHAQQTVLYSTHILAYMQPVLTSRG